MKGAYPHGTDSCAQQLLHTSTHFTGGLIREGNCKNAKWRDTFNLIEPCYAVSEYTCLTASGSGLNEQRTWLSCNGIALFGIEIIDYVGDIH